MLKPPFRRALGEAVDQNPLAASVSQASRAKVRPSKAPSQPTGEGKTIPTNPVRDAILSSMRIHPFFAQHPAETAADGTKYVSAFVGRNGRVIALDKAVATKQPMWVLDEPRVRVLLDSLGVPFDGYPPEKGRNSNLKKLPEFKDQALLRAFPRTEGEAMAIVEGVARLA